MCLLADFDQNVYLCDEKDGKIFHGWKSNKVHVCCDSFCSNNPKDMLFSDLFLHLLTAFCVYFAIQSLFSIQLDVYWLTNSQSTTKFLIDQRRHSPVITIFYMIWNQQLWRNSLCKNISHSISNCISSRHAIFPGAHTQLPILFFYIQLWFPFMLTIPEKRHYLSIFIKQWFS